MVAAVCLLPPTVLMGRIAARHLALGGDHTLVYILPYWPVDPLLSTSPWFNFDLDVTRCLRAIFPATLLWGASFPLALASAARGGRGPGASCRRGLCLQYGRAPLWVLWCSRWC